MVFRRARLLATPRQEPETFWTYIAGARRAKHSERA
ncbi:hypothetical protein A2U01_0100481 [Trifolium medium]|uniref:Uncharacterized protein n=1 Tax=Trifolium medium TaxID=97028 RepID=A0A392UYI0_9FABA|nr:hypothetical protein [Trifolium medium]